MRGRQLELDFESAIAQALADPGVAQPIMLWDSLQPSLALMDHASQLKIASQMFSDIAEVVHQRSRVLLEDWEDRYNTLGPVPGDDFLAELVQETMFLDVSELVRQPKGRRRVVPDVSAEEFFAEVADEEALLKELGVEEPEPEPEAVFAVIEEEDVQGWVDAIARVLDKAGGKVSLQKLKKILNLSYGRLWLGLLLGGFKLESSESSFYSTRIAVSCGALRATV